MSKSPASKLKLQHRFQPLRRMSRWPIWADVITRLGVAFLLIAIVVLVHWIDRAGLRDSHDGQISFLDVVYFTMISVTPLQLDLTHDASLAALRGAYGG